MLEKNDSVVEGLNYEGGWDEEQEPYFDDDHFNRSSPNRTRLGRFWRNIY